jgi:Dihydrodipicolinate synthetase family
MAGHSNNKDQGGNDMFFDFRSLCDIKATKMSIDWNGIFPALTTKFTNDDLLDIPLFEKNLQAQLDAGVKGIILGGTLGEASVLSISENRRR